MSEGMKFDTGKPRFDLVSAEFEKEMAAVMTFGAKKYAPQTWQTVPDAVNRYYAALRRHLAAYRSGEEFDEDSGLSHLAHVAINAMFLRHFEQVGNKDDNICKLLFRGNSNANSPSGSSGGVVS